MNTTKELNAWTDALRFLIADNTAPDAARADAKSTLTAYDRSLKMHDAEQQSANATLQSLRTLEQELHPQLVAQFYSGKKSTLDANVAQVEQLQSAWVSAQLRTRVVLQAHNHITRQVCGQAIRPHALELLQWIAQRRNSAPVTCGEVDTLPTPVQLIYKKIAPEWRTDWEEALTLHDVRQLPLIYNAAWDANYRASVSWVWEQVANGEVQQVPHPNDRRPNPPCRLLAPTRRVTHLTAVPPALTTPRR